MIVVIGAGSFGAAMGHCMARAGYTVTLLSRNLQRVAAINESETMPGYPSVAKPLTLFATTDVNIISKANYIMLALPVQQVRKFLEIHKSLFPSIPVLLLPKGIEKESGLLPCQVVAQYIGGPISVLAGPNFADEILKNMPTATTISSQQESNALEWAQLFISAGTLRPYVHTDIIGAQIGGAIKNIIAIACGVVRGLNLGENALAAIITRGLAEMVRLGLTMGAKKETFLGLSGVGDLTLTCNSLKSRNLRFGMALAKKDVWDEAENGTVEGYHTAFSVEKLIQQYNIEMPISECVLKLIKKSLSPLDAITALMGREIKQEVF